MDRLSRSFVPVVIAAGLMSLAGPAHAADPWITGSDYTVTYPAGRYAAPPANAVQLALVSDGLDGVAQITLPFQFDYFGWAFTQCWPCANGLLYFTNNSTGPSTGNSNNNAVLPSGGVQQGVVAPLWDDLNAKNYGKVVWWTDGTAGSRRVVVSWEGLGVGNFMPVGNVTFQVQLFETSHRIVFAYKDDAPMTTWLNLGYTAGLSPYNANIWAIGMTGVQADQRFCDAFNHSNTNTGHPPSDVQFDLTTSMHVTGRMVYDRVVADASGLGNSMEPNAPAHGARVFATQPADGLVVASAQVDATGAFDLVFKGRPVQQPILYASSESPAVAVRQTIGLGAFQRGLKQGTFFWTDTDAGTFSVTQAIEPDGAIRSAFAIVGAVQKAYDALAAAPPALPPQIDVVHDVGGAGLTFYTAKNGSMPASIRIGSAAGSNEDAWDAGVVVKVYARHVLATIAGATATYDARFDAVSDVRNAFAEAFGYALHALAAKTSVFVNAVGPSTATVIDLETVVPSARKGPDVAAWVASALYELLDPANETHDRVDGTSAADRFYRATEALAATPESVSFMDAWIAAGYDGLGLSRIYVADGLVADDEGEANDDAAEPRSLGDVPVLSQDRVLTKANEDWYSVHLAAAVPELRADLSWNRIGEPASVTFELVGPGGSAIATGVAQGSAGPIMLSAGPLAAGAYRLRIRHDSGVVIDPYSVQAYEPLAMTNAIASGWTQDRPLSLSVGAVGGVPARVLTADPPGTQPAGLYFSLDGDRVLGTPTTPGSYQLSLRLEDSGDPAHRVVASQSFVVNPPLDVDLAPFAGFPVGRAYEVRRDEPGGTAPRVFDVKSGALLSGLSLDAAALRMHGTVAAAGSAAVTIHGLDVAGSESEAEVMLVGAAALVSGKAETDLAAGDAACGVFIDALRGASISFAAGTVKGQAKRALTPWLVGPDGRLVEGAKLSPGSGKAKGSFAGLPASGRWFAIFASEDGAATRLSVSAATSPSKGAKGAAQVLDATHPLILEIGALAGASLDLSLKPQKGSGLVASVQQLLDPAGNAVSVAGLVTEKNGALRLVAPLPLSGTWTVRVAAKPATAGSISWSYKVKQPKGVTYAVD